MKHQHAIIVGGGIVGGAAALELLERGWAVTLVEKGAFGSGASGAAAGMLCPGAEIFDGDGGASGEIFSLSRQVYPDWVEKLEDGAEMRLQYRQSGMLRLLYDEAEALQQRIRAQERGLTWLESEAVRQLEPGIAPTVLGAVLFDEDASVHPKLLLKALKRVIERRGGNLLEGTPAMSLIADGHRVNGVETSLGPITGDVVVLAAGAWSQALVKPLGIPLPVVPLKGQMVAVSLPPVPISHILQGPDGMILPRWDGSAHIGVTMEQTGFDARRTIQGVSQIYRAVQPWAPWLRSAEFKTSWAGLRPMTPDRRPFIGLVPGFPGLVAATGHSSVGIFLAPLTAQLVADAGEGRPSRVSHPALYAPLRFMDES